MFIYFSKVWVISSSLQITFSTKEALKEAKGREGELEAEVKKVNHQMKEEIDKMVEQNQEEIRSVMKRFEEHQEKQLAEAREENSAYACNTLSVYFHVIVPFPSIYIPVFPDLVECCWRCRLSLHKEMRS